MDTFWNVPSKSPVNVFLQSILKSSFFKLSVMTFSHICKGINKEQNLTEIQNHNILYFNK